MLANWRQSWFFNIKGDVLAGITVALALIPEAIAFSIIAGVDPMVGIHSAFCIAVLIAIVGGRPGMISAATGAMSILMVTLVAKHGIEYLYAATILTGIIQFIIGSLKLGRFISFVPQSVLSGFLNALGIMIFTAQLQHFVDASWIVYVIAAVTLVIVYGLPRLTKAVPSTLVAIVLMTIITITAGIHVKTVGDMGVINSSFPMFHIPDIGFNLDTLLIILPVSATMAVVGLLESLLTATIIDEQTQTESDKNQEVRGQGIANAVTGFFGGMAGCAMIGQSMINMRSGGRGRLSTMVAGLVLLLLIIALKDVVVEIPMPALAGVMVMVACSTFDWNSIKQLRTAPISDSIIMVVTVIIVLLTDNLAYGVLVGVLLSAVLFVSKMAKVRAKGELNRKGQKVYSIQGPIFFATASDFNALFTPESDPESVIIDGSDSKVWDNSAIIAIEKVMQRYKDIGKEVELVHFDHESIKVAKKAGITITSEA